MRFIILIILLEQHKSLRVNERLSRIKVQGCFKISWNKVLRILSSSNGAVYETFLWISSIWNVSTSKSAEFLTASTDPSIRVKVAEVIIEIGSAVMYIQTLIDTKFVPWCSLASHRNIVLNYDPSSATLTTRTASNLPLVQSAVTYLSQVVRFVVGWP